mmetsp:Transcript_3739/g.3462  ORF Transcript_3739/g.3462 Transcript_3739/m.3462 type:complete len:305 (+) Transcript_3739:396-1310(+)
MGRSSSMLTMKNSRKALLNSKAMKDKIDAEKMTKQLNEILKSHEEKRHYHHSSMGTLPSIGKIDRPASKKMHPKHYPTSRLDQNKLMFNEIFVQPKMNQLKMLKRQREKDQIKLPSLPSVTKETEEENTTGELLAKHNTKSKNLEQSLDISSLMERRRFNKNSDNLFEEGFEEDAFKKIDEGEVQQFNTQDFKDLREKMGQPGRDMSVKGVLDVEDQGFETIMRNFREEQIQVQPPEGLINMIGSEGSWAPSIPLLNTSTNKSMMKTKNKERSTTSDASLMDIKMRAKAGVQAGDVKKEAHMAF